MEDTVKITYLANEYPDHNIAQVAGLFEMSPLDFNVAAWRAQDKGWIKVNDKTGKIKVKHASFNNEEFGTEVARLMDYLSYAFKKLGEDESDIEENYLANWTKGYSAHDLLIAIKLLEEQKVIGHYKITDVNEVKSEDGETEIVEDTYTFYSSWENVEKRWAAKQFKDVKKIK